MNKKTKVLHVLHAVGGVDVYLRLLIETINHDMFEHIIVKGIDDNTKSYFTPDGLPIKVYELHIKREINLINDFKVISQVVGIFKKEKPNVIHAHSAKGGIIARTASMFFKVNVLHTPHAYSYLSTENKLKRKIFLLIESFYAKRNSYLLATSKSEMERGIKDVGYKRNKTLLFNNSVLPIKIKGKGLTEMNLPKEYICTVGRPSYQKNIEMMVEVIKKVKITKPQIHLILMGVGEYSPSKEKINKLIQNYNLESNITLVKWIERDKILQIISKAKIYISTSRYEGLPYSIIESLALSKACVVTNCDGNRDLIKEGFNGFLIDNFDVNEMAKKISELLDNNSIREEFEKHSFDLFNRKFNLENNISKLERIYNRLKLN
ncbi:glycosyltransferase [Gaetbulibacter sp. M235]|uniref:glycosyltransferase n=1 Tax=Gaetbulibacter sp. M235 TaxID=3126510 RepID=UPI00374E859E